MRHFVLMHRERVGVDYAIYDAPQQIVLLSAHNGDIIIS